MSLEEQVLSIEQMRYLNKLGFKVYETSLCWYMDCFNNECYYVGNNKRGKNDFLQEETEGLYSPIPTLTLQEILSLFPIGIDNLSLKFNNDNIGYYDPCGICYKECNFILDSLKGAYDLLCWLIENKYLNKN